MWANFGDKTEEGGLNFIYSLMQDIKFCKQQFQQQDLHVLERLAAIEAHLKLQQQRICNLEQALNQAPKPPELLAVKAPPPYLGQFTTPSPAETINANVECAKQLAVKAHPPYLGQLTTPSPAENVKVDDAKPLPVKAPPPCLGHIASFMPAETVNVKVDDAKPIPVKAHPPPLPLKAPPPPPPVTAKVFAGTGPLTAVQVIEHAKQLPVKAPPEFPVKYPPPHCDQGMTAWPDFSPGDL